MYAMQVIYVDIQLRMFGTQTGSTTLIPQGSFFFGLGATWPEGRNPQKLKSHSWEHSNVLKWRWVNQMKVKPQNPNLSVTLVAPHSCIG